MPVSQDYIVQALRKKGYTGAIPGQAPTSQAPPQVPQQTQGLIPDLLNKLSPALATTVAQGARGYLGKDASSTFGQDDINKLYAQESIKSQFRPKKQELQGYIAVPDGEGGFQYIPNPAGSKVQIAPGAVTEAGQGKIVADTGKSTQQGRLAGNQADFMDNITGGKGVSGNNPFVVPDMTIGGIHAVNPEVQRNLDSNKPENSADAGRSTLANESIQGIDEVIKTLFPTGKPESFQRGIATGSNLPGIRLPLAGRITPSVRPDNPLDNSDDMDAQQAQNVFRRIGSALSGRQLIQTGVAARPEETQRLVEQFAPGMTSNPQASWDGLQQLRQFYVDYLSRVNRTNTPGGQALPPTSSSGFTDPQKEARYQSWKQSQGQA